MSIIHEALKKAGQERENIFTAKDSDSIRKNLQLEFEKKKQGLNWGPVFVVLVLLLITGPLVAPIFSAPFKKGSLPLANLESTLSQNVPAVTPVLPSLLENPVAHKAQFGIEERALSLPAFPPDLSLSGIMYSPADASYCIINNKIVKVGDTVQGARLVNVKPDQVVLDYQNQQIVLKSEAVV